MQTVYNMDQAKALVGMLVDLTAKTVVSRIGTLAIPFGVFVCRDGADDKVKVPALTTDVTGANGMAGGFALATQAMEQTGAAVPSYPAKAAVSVLKSGKVMVKVEEAVVQGEQAFIRFASGAGGTQLGAVRKSADTATAVALPGAYFGSSAGAGELAILEFNI